ncbi:hypothetical protein CASFOL_028681 [Castilleja foliolosa]|uniref:Uncharacterized protein n=1 Tax=Castilleja foliolosa TaxID=1961234 RepID=A0ABD3BBV0_9LAMI
MDNNTSNVDAGGSGQGHGDGGRACAANVFGAWVPVSSDG